MKASMMRPVRPDMGEYYYTRAGLSAYVAYSLEEGSVLPLFQGRKPYPKVVGMVYGIDTPVCWKTNGTCDSAYRAGLDLVERITMETAFAYPKRSARPKPKTAIQLGMLL